MADSVGPAGDERERLEHFLEWRRAVRTGRRRRSVVLVTGGLALGAVASVLGAASLGRSVTVPPGVASGRPDVPPAGVVVTPFREVPTVPPSAIDARTQLSSVRRRSPPQARGRRTKPNADASARAPDRPTLTRGDEGDRGTTSEVSPPAPTVATPTLDTVAAASPPTSIPSDQVVAVEPPEEVASSSVTTPPVVTGPPPIAVVPEPTTAASPRSETIETVKRLVGYMPEVRLGKALVRWVRSRPAIDHGNRPPTPDAPQAR